MKTRWQCKFKDHPENITVGQKFLLLCDGEPEINFQKPIHIKFLDKKHDYSLHVLNTLKKESHFLALEVTSYRTGNFKQPFIITDGERGFTVEDLSFTVQSVLEKGKEPPKTYGPYGPFTPPPPVWLISITAFSFFCLLTCVFIFLRRLLKRKQFIQKVLDRKNHLNPSRSFIMGLRQMAKNPDYPVKKLENLFKAFLEDLFFIPAQNQSAKQIMKNLKNSQKAVYKKEGRNLHHVLNELSAGRQKNKDKKIFLELKKICQKMVFLLDRKGN